MIFAYFYLLLACMVCQICDFNVTFVMQVNFDIKFIVKFPWYIFLQSIHIYGILGTKLILSSFPLSCTFIV